MTPAKTSTTNATANSPHSPTTNPPGQKPERLAQRPEQRHAPRVEGVGDYVRAVTRDTGVEEVRIVPEEKPCCKCKERQP